MMKHAIGIDLGTTNSVISQIRADGSTAAIPNGEGDLTTPSVVHINADGSAVVGKPALAYITDNAITFKRILDHPEHTLTLAGRAMTPVQLSTAVLSKLRHDAEVFLGEPVYEVVISVPAHFGHIERNATRQAAQAAGLHALMLISEPVAAAMAYLKQNIIVAKYFVVFDLGGGTLDITLLETTLAAPFVKGTTGAVDLGGQDFTNIIITQCQQQYEAQQHVPLDIDAQNRLARAADLAKIALSTVVQTTLAVGATNGPTMTITITRQEFETWISGYLFRMRMMINLLLGRLNVKPNEVDKVILVGGSSPIPSVQSLLQDIFKRDLDTSLNPDLAVSWGAAVLAQTLTRGDVQVGGSRSDDVAVIQESINHHIGVAVPRRSSPGEYELDIVLRQDSDKYGQWNSRLYHPVTVNAPSISIRIHQGDTKDLKYCRYIGTLTYDLPANSTPDTTTITVEMRLNRSGILEVRVSLNGGPPHHTELHTDS